VKSLLMVAYHFPPLAGSSGMQRTLRFCQHLPALGWQPHVLSAHPRAYERLSDDLMPQIPAQVQVTRAFALDTRRHLSLWQRYPGWLARPDRWVSWVVGAVPAGLRIIAQQRPAAIWSTYPIASAHLVGYWLARLSGLPWVADFRDPMAHVGYPQDPATWQSYLRVEQKVFAQAARIVFATPGAARLYSQRYPQRAGDVRVIENGFDEPSFAHVPALQPALNPGRFTLLHSGIVYPQWRNPQALFATLRQLMDAGRLQADALCVRFRAPEHESFLQDLVARHGLTGVVQIEPPVGYQAALAEMCAADALLVLQSDDCNDQIPAKVYEYLRARKPVLGLCGTGSDTAALLQRAGVAQLAPLDNPQAIGQALTRLLQQGQPINPNSAFVESLSRRAKAEDLAALLNRMVAEQPARSPAAH